MPAPTKIFFQTADAVTIIGDFVFPEDECTGAALCLHMMPADRFSYAAFQQVIAGCGIASLAIDLRGHGESRSQGNTTLDYTSFTDEDHQKSILDCEAAMEYLRTMSHCADQDSMVIGASIGANLALWFQALHPELPLSVLLSPGINYRGIDTTKLITQLTGNQRSVLCSTTGDEYSYTSVTTLQRMASPRITCWTYEGTEHGTDVLLIQECYKQLIGYLCQGVKGKSR